MRLACATKKIAVHPSRFLTINFLRRLLSVDPLIGIFEAETGHRSTSESEILLLVKDLAYAKDFRDVAWLSGCLHIE